MGNGSVFHRMVPAVFHPRSQGVFGEGRVAIKRFTDAPGLLQFVSIEDENVHVIFLPPTTTSLLQPLDQGIICCVKASYARQVFEMIRAAIDANPNLQVSGLLDILHHC